MNQGSAGAAALRSTTLKRGSLCGARAWPVPDPGGRLSPDATGPPTPMGAASQTVSSDGLPSRTITMRASLDLSGPVREASIILLPRALGILRPGPATREPPPLPRDDAHVRALCRRGYLYITPVGEGRG